MNEKFDPQQNAAAGLAAGYRKLQSFCPPGEPIYFLKAWFPCPSALIRG
jgi:hypothetical protein